MSAFKPRKLDSRSLFVTDYREESKFWFLDPVVQPIVAVAPNGQFRPPSSPIDYHTFAWAGDAAHQIEDEDLGHIWIAYVFTILSAAGATITGMIDGQPCGTSAVVAAGEAGSLIQGPASFNGAEAFAALLGVGADVLAMKAIRVI